MSRMQCHRLIPELPPQVMPLAMPVSVSEPRPSDSDCELEPSHGPVLILMMSALLVQRCTVPTHSEAHPTQPDMTSSSSQPGMASSQPDMVSSQPDMVLQEKQSHSNMPSLAEVLADHFMQPHDGRGLRIKSIDGDWFIRMPHYVATVHPAGTLQMFSSRSVTVIMAARGRELMCFKCP